MNVQRANHTNAAIWEYVDHMLQESDNFLSVSVFVSERQLFSEYQLGF